jgi:hypothetical protein
VICEKKEKKNTKDIIHIIIPKAFLKHRGRVVRVYYIKIKFPSWEEGVRG